MLIDGMAGEKKTKSRQHRHEVTFFLPSRVYTWVFTLPCLRMVK
jgi:hypothetical protein